MGWITKRAWVGKGRKEGKTRKGVVFPAGIWVYGMISFYVHTKIEPIGKYIVDKNQVSLLEKEFSIRKGGRLKSTLQCSVQSSPTGIQSI